MRILILAIVGLVSYLIILVPGYFFFVPVNKEIEETSKSIAEEVFEEPGKEPLPK